jgi:hypothetical protein
MNIRLFPRWIMFPLLTTLAMLACNISASPPASIPVTGQNTATDTAGPTATEQPTSTPIIIIREVTVTSSVANPPAPTSTSEPSCTVLQDLNLRSGPGTAYRPPLTSLPGGSVVTPLGYVPQGIPGGTWAYVQDFGTLLKGWVSAGSDYISCNTDISELPEVAYADPPPFFPSTSQASPGTGNGFCVDPDSGLECVGFFSDESLFQFQIFRNGRELGENDGVGPVSFTITRNGDLVYSHVENNVPYCIFGGNNQCNSWVFEDGVYKWESGGNLAKSGKYKVGVDVNVDGDDSHWEAEFRVDFP